MHLPAHLALGWLVGHRAPKRWERVWIAWAGVAPDVDALSMLAGEDAYATYHHVLCHGVVFAAIVAAVVTIAQGWKTGVLACAAFHAHLLADMMGSGREWPIRYWWPFSDKEYGFSWGWELASWQNTLIMVALLATMVLTAKQCKRTFAETFLPARIADKVTQAVWRRS